MESYLETLPPEVLAQSIINYDLPKVLKFCKLSPAIGRVCQNHYFWNQKLHLDFGVHSETPKATYFQYYANHLRKIAKEVEQDMRSNPEYKTLVSDKMGSIREFNTLLPSAIPQLKADTLLFYRKIPLEDLVDHKDYVKLYPQYKKTLDATNKVDKFEKSYREQINQLLEEAQKWEEKIFF